MKIEIRNTDNSGSFGYEIYCLNNNKRIHNYKNSLLNQRFFDENEILNLIGDKKYKQFESGKFTFDVSKNDIFRVTDDLNYFTMPK